MILSICDNPDILKIMNLIILIINIIKVAVPIILILTLMIRFTSSVAKSNEDALESIKKSAPANIIAAVLIFLVPTFVSIVTKISFPNSDFVKCLSGASNETIAASYAEKAEKLVAKAELSLKINDYTAAMNYLKNLSNSGKKEELAKRLEAIREKLNVKPSTPTESGKYSKVNYSNFKWVYYEAGTGPIKDYYSGGIPYAIRAPENVSDLNGVSLPLIIFFHGAGEEKKKISGNIFIKNGVFQKLITSWNNYGLQTIPAIMISPHAYGSFDYLETNFETISALIEYAKDKYNIDMDRIVLMGHSMGADDTVSVPYKFHTKYNKDYFNAYVMFSASTKLSASPYNDSNDIKEYFTGKKIKGYSENNLCEGFFNLINVPLTVYSGAGHNKVPEKALTEDLNNDGVSDIMYWLFGEDAKVKTNSSVTSTNGELASEARKYVNQNVGLDCSGFVKNKVLKPLGYLQSEIANTSAQCDGRSRGSYGMYKKYLENGQMVWKRDSSAVTMSQALSSFPGNCAAGDIIFYSYGANDCVKHVAMYVGYENGNHMIIDSNMSDNTVRYRGIDKVYSTAMPLGCARARKAE